MLNAIKYTKELESNGFERNQAESLVGMFMQMIEFNMVSKNDFDHHKSFVTQKFEQIDKRFEQIDKRFEQIDKRFEQIEEKLFMQDQKMQTFATKDDLRALEMRIDQKLNQLSLQLTLKLGVMLALSVGLISTILSIKL